MAFAVSILCLALFAGFVQVKAGCLMGFTAHNSYCYYLMPVKATWAEAEQYCEAYGASLAVIQDDAEQAFVANLLGNKRSTIKSDHVWLGATDLLQEGAFYAVKTATALTYYHWANGEPDNVNGQHCLSMFTNDPGLVWDDDHCEAQHVPFCKMRATQAEIVG